MATKKNYLLFFSKFIMSPIDNPFYAIDEIMYDHYDTTEITATYFGNSSCLHVRRPYPQKCQPTARVVLIS